MKLLFEFGRIKRHKYPLAKYCIRIDRSFKFHKPIQWCFIYKMFKIGFIEFYYESLE